MEGLLLNYHFKGIVFTFTKTPHNYIMLHSKEIVRLRSFECSVKTFAGLSINQSLLVGPWIQNDFFSSCIPLRRHKYAFSVDIERMLRQIWIADKHFRFLYSFMEIFGSWTHSPLLSTHSYIWNHIGSFFKIELFNN